MHRLLVVEPDRSLAETIFEYLKPDFEVSVAHDAQEAITLADTKRPDLVILELALAKHNGIAFLQEFRSYTDWLVIPIVIYSQIPRDDIGLSEAEWHKYGVVAYLYKPTATLANLLQNIQNNLNNYEIT